MNDGTGGVILIDVMTREEATRLLAQGKVEPPEATSRRGVYQFSEPAYKFAKTKRVGIWLYTSNFYSGGRIHMYQYAISLAEIGCEVFLITNDIPRWAKDYPDHKLLRILIEGKDKIPPDIDLIVTDSKTQIGRAAAAFKGTHPSIPLICMNFETPNWVREYCPEYAEQLHQDDNTFKKADVLLANSTLSGEYLLKWLGKSEGHPVYALPPAVNTHAVENLRTVEEDGRPYAVWSARSPAYKGGRVALDALLSLDIPFDLHTFGRVKDVPRLPPEHRVIECKGRSDRDKFTAMRNAHMVLAPSLFEGFGMVPAEALSVGTQCIVYDLPVLRQEYGDREGLHYVKWGDEKAYMGKVREVARMDKPNLGTTPLQIRTDHGMETMRNRVEMLPYHAMNRTSVSAHMVAYWGVLPQSLESVYPHVDQISIAFGRVPHAPRVDDGSLEMIQEWIKHHDTESKITLEVRDEWPGKAAMRTWGVARSEGNYQLLLDGDEVWVGLEEWIEAKHNFGCPRWINFWHDIKHWVKDTAEQGGSRWGKGLDPFGSICPHYRWSWWRPSYSFHKHHALPVDGNEQGLHLRDGDASCKVPSSMIYHFGHALPSDVMLAKHQFYRGRDGDNEGSRNREKVWHGWNGVPGDHGDGLVCSVDWDLPDIVLQANEYVQRMGGQERVETNSAANQI